MEPAYQSDLDNEAQVVSYLCSKKIICLSTKLEPDAKKTSCHLNPCYTMECLPLAWPAR